MSDHRNLCVAIRDVMDFHDYSKETRDAAIDELATVIETLILNTVIRAVASMPGHTRVGNTL